MKSKTETRIFHYLDRHLSTTVDDLSITLGLTKENIHYHLQKMCKEGTVQRKIIPIRKPIQRGRPTYQYSLSGGTKSSNINHLADQLLSLVLKDELQIDQSGGVLEKLADAMFTDQSSKNLTQNLQQTILKLNQHNYQAAWEARITGPIISFRNCPYSLLIRNHPEICLLDRLILSKMLNSDSITQTSKMDIDIRNPPTCTFLVNPGMGIDVSETR